MGCQACKDADNETEMYYYRWGTSNVAVIGCQEHVKQIFEVLNSYQSKLKE